MGNKLSHKSLIQTITYTINGRYKHKVGKENLTKLLSVYVLVGGDLTKVEQLFAESLKESYLNTVKLGYKSRRQLQDVEEWILRYQNEYP